MQQNPEIYFVTIIGIILGLLLVGFIVTILFLYQKRQQRQEQEMSMIKDKYEKEALRSQLEIQENTFRTIAQELHDNIGQMLSVVKLSLSALPMEPDHPAFELIRHSREVLNKAIFDLSDLTKSLHSDRITDVGLVESMRFELASIKKAGLIEIQFAVSGDEFHIPEQKAIFLFRMFQEMINNILKHSRARQVTVRVSYYDDNTFALEVEDNGVGFNVMEKQQSVSSSRGVGLKSMFNRARLMGADIDISSEEGKGTYVLVKLYPEKE
jgi:two-component system, NarL family, sensor kinase